MLFRPLGREDLGLLSNWLARPHVERWWREDYDLAAVERRYGPSVDGLDATEVFIVEHDGAPVGMAQRYRLDDEPEWRRVLEVAGTPGDAACIDYLIGEAELTGRGLGTELVAAFSEDTLIRYPDVPAIVVSVQQDNRRSWRALEKAGFSRYWAGELDSDDPSDEGPGYVYILYRPEPNAAVHVHSGRSGSPRN